MTQIGQCLYFNEGPIHHIDLQHQLNQSEGGGTCVRVWHRLNDEARNGMPAFRDFRGAAARTITRNVTNLNRLGTGSGGLILLPATEEEEGEEVPKTAAGNSKTQAAGRKG